ncbi:hypothetical protein OUZ56_007541 [Daphnia magna]|uniref:Uncharacterized protein n=1 Tax=Daphnia magna TaxID=35525 RepID=A0ABR0AA90_9CRUS|nr:hypothetical protein OUZ56_007541 [Daphnia magna]
MDAKTNKKPIGGILVHYGKETRVTSLFNCVRNRGPPRISYQVGHAWSCAICFERGPSCSGYVVEAAINNKAFLSGMTPTYTRQS